MNSRFSPQRREGAKDRKGITLEAPLAEKTHGSQHEFKSFLCGTLRTWRLCAEKYFFERMIQLPLAQIIRFSLSCSSVPRLHFFRED
ncbi:MAG: hypothetical protein H6R18_1270 [Proteobacteria bacterium]|nr:hypothetical protein [Pseudomonadota bacterium]